MACKHQHSKVASDAQRAECQRIPACMQTHIKADVHTGLQVIPGRHPSRLKGAAFAVALHMSAHACASNDQRNQLGDTTTVRLPHHANQWFSMDLVDLGGIHYKKPYINSEASILFYLPNPLKISLMAVKE